MFACKSRACARRKAAKCVQRPRRIRTALGNHRRGAGTRFGLLAGDGKKSRAVAPFRPPCLEWPAELGKAEQQSHGRMLATRFEGRPPRLFRLAGAVLAFAYLLPGLVQLGLDFVVEFKLILEEFLKPFLEFYLFLRREFRDGGFDFLHGAHVDKSTLRVRTRQGSRNCAVTVDGDGHWAEVPQGRPTMASPAIAERNNGDAGSDRAMAGDGDCGLRGQCLRE